MSWDLIVFSADTPLRMDAEGVAEFADHWTPPPMGSEAEIRRQISDIFPDTDWTDPHWGVVIGEGFTFEFSLNGLARTNSFGIHARGAATGAALRLMAATGWRLLDVSTTRWLNLAEDPDAGRRKHKAYVDKILAAQNDPKPPSLLARLFRR
ncbi:hypothetical protein [Roseovarius sp.]|uniref:hypothetical protein n=1 Tax=Roseovarius sp. TaxID=1486281 RepID=UPI000C3CF170|nr:hypothetical protein [Roseovarius sp.]MAZ21706.1 hypothetical protein [Roseovarius sp.]|tara:strand:+ start:708 stop:1163 length:456 start_codon:yes stop_codon:yes gene_type:complete